YFAAARDRDHGRRDERAPRPHLHRFPLPRSRPPGRSSLRDQLGEIHSGDRIASLEEELDVFELVETPEELSVHYHGRNSEDALGDRGFGFSAEECLDL